MKDKKCRICFKPVDVKVSEYFCPTCNEARIKRITKNLNDIQKKLSEGEMKDENNR